MKAARVLEQLVRSIKEGRVSDDVAGKLLSESGVQLTVGSKVGTYSDGMLHVNGANHGLDPLQVTKFAFPIRESQDPLAKPEAPKRVIEASAKSELPFGNLAE